MNNRMKANKEAIFRLSNFGRIMYLMGALGYKETRRNFPEGMDFIFHMRLWHPAIWIVLLVAFVGHIFSFCGEVKGAISNVCSGTYLKDS